MSNSVTLTFGEPKAPPPPMPEKPVKPAGPAAFTREERRNNFWHVRLLAWVLGLPSVLSVGFVGLVGLFYAYVATGDAKTWLALSAGIIIVTLFVAGLPIGAALNRGEPVIARAALGFWGACFLLLFGIMTHFAMYRPEPAPVAPATIADAPEALPVDDPDETDNRIADLRETIGEAVIRTPEDARRLDGIKAQLRTLERQRYGRPVFQGTPPKTAEPAPAAAAPHGPGLDLAAVALLVLIGAALGLLISASSLAAVLTEKAATARAEADNAPAPLPAAHSPAYHPGESADGFDAWAIACVSRLQGGRVRPGEAHTSYLAFCARNDYAAPLPLPEFGRRLRSWLTDTYGLSGHHSNGTVYEGIALAPLLPSITAPAVNGTGATMNGAAH
jgi:hypothetical protein